MMRALSRRRILSLRTMLILPILACSTLVILYILPEYTSHPDSDVARGTQLQQADARRTFLSLPTRSICPSREALKSEEIKRHSGRKPDTKYFLTIGIPTVVRKSGSGYLMSTLKSLVKENEDSGLPILLVVFLADENVTVRNKLRNEIYDQFKTHIESGTIDIIEAPPSFYPRPEKLKRRFGDSVERVKWRSKQVVDYAFLLCYCNGLAQYHMQIEDDVVASPQYVLKVKDFIEYHEKRKITWFTLDAAVLGYIGKIYHSGDLQQLGTFFYNFFDEMPVDWLGYMWRDLKGQRPRFRYRQASLFQHIGYESTLLNKKQKLHERFFDKYSQKFLGLNPPAAVYTDLEPKLDTKLEDAYNKGGDYFRGLCQKDSCSINVIFRNVTTVKKLHIGSGATFIREDIFENGTVLAGTTPQKDDCLNYDHQKPMHFKKNGELEEVFSAGLNVSCFKIIIKKLKHWVFLREINVWTK